jgi:uncharacterized membrane protein
MTMAKIEKIIFDLREVLQNFKISEMYNNVSSVRQDVKMIEVALLIVEMGIENNRAINEEDMNWFNGCYIIDYTYGGSLNPWKKIPDLYCQLCDLVAEKNYFRK